MTKEEANAIIDAQLGKLSFQQKLRYFVSLVAASNINGDAGNALAVNMALTYVAGIAAHTAPTEEIRQDLRAYYEAAFNGALGTQQQLDELQTVLSVACAQLPKTRSKKAVQ